MSGDPRPKRRWPGGAEAVVCITIHVDGPCVQIGRGIEPLGIHSIGRYAMRRGVPRYLDMLDHHGVPATFFVCGHDAEQYPKLISAIHGAGHEIAAHGYQHEGWDLGEREPELLEKTHRILTDLTGVAPVGWCSPSGRKSRLTIPTLRRLGYRYDASEKDDDLPYVLEDGAGGPADFVILPNNTVSLDDYPFYQTGQVLASEVLENCIEEFDALRTSEGYIHLTVHPMAGSGSGTPARAGAVDAFLSHVRNTSGVQIVTLAELAGHCLDRPQEWRARP
jgi:peptidoglycan/xylan/chitin deacetylase (PgdA/CDA1 family)